MNMKLYELNPHIRYARIHKTAVSLKKEVRICYDCRMFYFDNVSGTITINGVDHLIASKTVTFLPPETHYVFCVEFYKDAKAIVMDFDLTSDHADLRSSLGTATLSTFDPARVPAYKLPMELSGYIIRTMPQLDSPLSQCCDNFLLQQPFFREKSSARLKICLLEMVQANQQSSRSKICDAVLSYIHEHYGDSGLTNKEIALHFGYNPEHLSYLICQETGKTLHQYLIYYRIQMAKNYLVTTQYDISEIAWRSGFCSAAYFIKIFREHNGRTPRAYRLLKIHTEL